MFVLSCLLFAKAYSSVYGFVPKDHTSARLTLLRSGGWFVWLLTCQWDKYFNVNLTMLYCINFKRFFWFSWWKIERDFTGNVFTTRRVKGKGGDDDDDGPWIHNVGEESQQCRKRFSTNMLMRQLSRDHLRLHFLCSTNDNYLCLIEILVMIITCRVEQYLMP